MSRMPALMASLAFSLSSFLSSSFSSLVRTMGLLPMIRSRASPSMTLEAFFSICSPARCTSRSDMKNTGSSSFSPMFISIVVPSFFTTTPWSARGRATH